MARIRTIKPEFWRSPDTAAASAVARLLYIAMWNWADDAGRGEADLKALEGFAFPNDDVSELSGGTSDNFRHVLAEVQKCFGVVFYQVSGKPYYEIPTWAEHQRNERSAKGKHPRSECGVTWDFMVEPTPGKTLRRKTAELPTISVPGTGEQGNIGTGEHRNIDVDSESESESNGVIEPELELETEPAPKPVAKDNRFDEFWKAYPRKEAKGKARDCYAKALKLVDAQTLIDAATRYAQDPNRVDQFTKIPTTWLNQECWTDAPLPPRSSSTSSSARPGWGEDVASLERAKQHLLGGYGGSVGNHPTLALAGSYEANERPF